MEPFARTVNATRSYGPAIALDGVSLDVPAGQLLGLLGPNGAGKTTLLQLLAGLRRPTSGTVEIFGGDPREASRRRRLGSTPPRRPGCPRPCGSRKLSTSSPATSTTRCQRVSCWSSSA